MLFRKNIIKNIFKITKNKNNEFIVFEINSDGESESVAYRVASENDVDFTIEKIINDIDSVDKTRFFHWFDLKRQEVMLSDIYDGDFEIKIYPSSLFEGQVSRRIPDVVGIVNEHIKSS